MAHDASDDRTRRSRRVAIIGAGPGGIATAVSLLVRGHDDFVILEKAPGIGGTWFHNRYPGAECDIKSHLYSFSFAPNPAWSRRYARQPEIKAYLEDVVDRFGVREHIRLSTPVRTMRWDDDESVWHITVGDGEGTDEIVDADIVVSAIGMFGEPVVPEVPGLDRFEEFNEPISLLVPVFRTHDDAPPVSGNTGSRSLSRRCTSAMRWPVVVLIATTLVKP